MTFKESIRVCLNKYADFDGRARRSEYIYFTLFVGLVSGVLAVLFGDEHSNGLLSQLWTLATVLPVASVSVRRLHDTNRKWTWYLAIIVPLLNLYLLYLLIFKEGDAGENQYGPDPKAVDDGIVSISAEAVSVEPAEETTAEEEPETAPEQTVTPPEPEIHKVEEPDIIQQTVHAAQPEPDPLNFEEPDIIQQTVHAEYNPTEEIKLDVEEPVAPVFPNPLDDSPICPGCGARVKKTDKFCGLCGTKL